MLSHGNAVFVAGTKGPAPAELAVGAAEESLEEVAEVEADDEDPPRVKVVVNVVSSEVVT